MRRKLRWLAGVALVVALAAVAWVAVTIFWQEPYTAWVHHREERKLEEQLRVDVIRNVQVTVHTTTHHIYKAAPVLPRIRAGNAVGRLSGPHVNAILTYGRNNINAGPGLWHARPGQNKTVVISGHRTTYGAPFRHIDELHKGDQLTLKSPWGTWRYKVYRKAVVRPTELWVTRNLGYEQVVLTACHPPYSAAYRYVVFARLTSSS